MTTTYRAMTRGDALGLIDITIAGAGNLVAEIADYEDDGSSGVFRLVDGVPVELIGTDGGEPEDQTLNRNWSWVVGALTAAYVYGAAEGSAGAPDAEARFHANEDLTGRIQANRADPGRLVERGATLTPDETVTVDHAADPAVKYLIDNLQQHIQDPNDNDMPGGTEAPFGQYARTTETGNTFTVSPDSNAGNWIDPDPDIGVGVRYPHPCDYDDNGIPVGPIVRVTVERIG